MGAGPGTRLPGRLRQDWRHIEGTLEAHRRRGGPPWEAGAGCCPFDQGDAPRLHQGGPDDGLATAMLGGQNGDRRENHPRRWSQSYGPDAVPKAGGGRHRRNPSLSRSGPTARTLPGTPPESAAAPAGSRAPPARRSCAWPREPSAAGNRPPRGPLRTSTRAGAAARIAPRPKGATDHPGQLRPPTDPCPGWPQSRPYPAIDLLRRPLRTEPKRSPIASARLGSSLTAENTNALPARSRTHTFFPASAARR